MSKNSASVRLVTAILAAGLLSQALPATGMAVTIDIGDPTNIHPKNKQEVGRRAGRFRVTPPPACFRTLTPPDHHPCGATLKPRQLRRTPRTAFNSKPKPKS